MSVIIETSLGDFTVDLYTDERPKCCKNFLKLCKVKYYNFCLFHSVQRNFIAQTGDPTNTGKGGESIHGILYGDQARYFDWEFVPKIKHAKSGLISMVNNGNNMHGSQFFVTLGDSLDYLDGVHTVFGEVTEGIDVITKLNEAYCDEKFRPFRDIRIHHTIIIEDPFEDPPGLDMPDRSPSPTPEVIERARLAADAEIDDLEGKTEEEIKEIMEEREERSNAQILEMIGDLPSTDITAPENVLFVCKLNSVTTDEDLEIIFSRFGPIKSCEVIRDHKTGESLQYAFIEFEKKEDCESAYFKMDNVLIDDRRIHVDFSQSVSKIKWKGKGKGVETFKDDPKKPKYIIKDKSQRQDNNYDLVFDEDEQTNRNSEQQQKERSHDNEDNNRHKRKQKYKSRSRSPLEIRRRQRSPDRERRDERGRRDDRRDRYISPPRQQSYTHSSAAKYKEYRQRTQEQYRDSRYVSPPRHRDTTSQRSRGHMNSSPTRYKFDRLSSPQRYQDRHTQKGKKGRDESKYKSDSEERYVNKKTKNKKNYNEEEVVDRKKRRKNNSHDSPEDDVSIDRKRLEKKKIISDNSDRGSSVERISKKKKKNVESSDEETEKRRKQKKKKKEEMSFQVEKEDKKKKKKKKRHTSSSEEEVSMKHKHEKKHKNQSNDRQIYGGGSDSESPNRPRSKKYSDMEDRKEKHRQRDKQEYRYRK